MPATSPTPASKAPHTYLALGDSYTIGESVPKTAQWGRQLTDLLRQQGVAVAAPVTIARTGWTTTELASAIQEADLAPRYDLVSLLIGVNDQYQGLPVSAYRAGFTELLQTSVRLAGGDPARVLVLSIPDWGATPFAEGRDRQLIAREIDAFNAVAKEETEKAGIAFLDITPLTRTYGNDAAYLAEDNLHYSGNMHREWALLALPLAQKIVA